MRTAAMDIGGSMRTRGVIVAQLLAAVLCYAVPGCGLPGSVDFAHAVEPPPPAVVLPAPPAAVSDNGLHKTPVFRKFGVAEGLPSSSAHQLAEDRAGFIWIATVDGLARYDGVGFRIYRHDPDDPGSIAGNDVTTLFIDNQDRIWCGLESAGLDMLDSGRRTFVHFRHRDDDSGSLAPDDVWVLGEDAQGALLVGTGGSGLDRLVPGSKRFTHAQRDPASSDSLSSNKIMALLSDRSGRLWLGSDYGLDRRRIDGASAAEIYEHADFSALRSDKGRLNVRKLLDDDAGGVLAATNRGLVRVDEQLKASLVASSELTHKAVFSMAFDDEGELWLGTQHGLNRRGRDGRIDGYLASAYLSGALSGNFIPDLLRDHEGNMWIATDDGGVMQLAATWRNFSVYRHDAGDPASLSVNRAQGLAIDSRGGVWAVNTEGGIERIDPASGRVEHYAGRLPPPASKALLAVALDRDGLLWVGHAAGVRIYRLDAGTFEDLPVDASRSDALTAGGISAFAEGGSGQMWAVSTGRALHRVDPGSHRITRFEAGGAGLRSVDINQIAFDARGQLLIASSAGLDRYDETARRFAAVPGTPARMLTAFAFAPDTTLWLLEDDALEQFRAAADGLARIGHYAAADGWSSATFTGMQVDADGHVWVSGARGLWRYDWKARKVRRFTVEDGLPNVEIIDAPLVQRMDGTMFAATLGGIVGFVPARIVENTLAPRVVLDTASVRRGDSDIELALSPAAAADESRRPESVRAPAPIEVRWGDRDIRFRARALSYANPGSNRYQWQLKGFDTGWVDTGNRAEREFSQLPAGRHLLKLRASNSSGVWQEIAPLVLEQAAPPWATRWAYALYALIVLGAVWLALRAYRLRVERRHAFALAEQQREFAEQASSAKTSFLATMGHEIRTPMTGVLGMTELLLRTPLDAQQRGYAEAIASSGAMMLRLINDSLDMARIEAGKLELEDAPLDLHALVGEIAALEQTLAQGKGLAFTCAIATDAPQHVRGDALRIKQIFLNLVNNAIKFTERGSVGIELVRGSNGAVQFSVRDTGPGIGESTRAHLFQRFEQAQGTQQRHGGSGLGLAICRELVARMSGEIALDSKVGVGSRFVVSLPLTEISGAQDASPAAAHETAVEVRAASATAVLHILLVEDDATVARVIVGLLEALGHRVRHVAQGLAALAEIEIEIFDAALLDLDLPGVDGLALARLIRAGEKTGSMTRLCLLGISARSAGNEEALCLDAGMDAFLRKPLTGKMLAAALARAR